MNTITILAGPDKGWEGVAPLENYGIHFTYEEKIYSLSFSRLEMEYFLAKLTDPMLDSADYVAQVVRFYPKHFEKFLLSKRSDWQRINEDGDPITESEQSINQ